MDEQRQARLRKFEQIERRLVAVLKQAAGWLPPEQLADMQSLAADHGEYGISFENFCTQLYEYGRKVPEAMVRELAAIAAMMEMPLPPWIGDDSWTPPGGPRLISPGRR